MMGERVALLLGLFVVPALILWTGHRFRDRSPRARNAFWGGVMGHAAGLTTTLIASVNPAVWWAGGPFLRDFAVHWSPLLLAMAGAAAGAVLGRRES
jgi:hypothetical protein